MLDFVFHPSGVWRQADARISELPQFNPEASSAASKLLVLAGGLALVLSRCSAREIERCYPRSHELYRFLRCELRRNGSAQPDPALLLDAFHEVAELLDTTSRRALRQSLLNPACCASSRPS